MAKAKSSNNESAQESKTRTTVFIADSLIEKLDYINYKDKSTRTDIVNEALADYIKGWEKDNGRIPAR